MCMQLNGPVLKSFKTKQSGPKSEKNRWPKILYFILDRARAEIFSFGLGQAWADFFFLYFKPGWAKIASLQAGPSLKNPAHADF